MPDQDPEQDPGRAKLVRDALLVPRSVSIEDALKAVRKYFSLDERGTVHSEEGLADLSDRKKVTLQILGGFFAHEARLVESAEVELGELARRCGVTNAIAKARAHELKSEGIVDSPRRGVFRLNEHRLKDAIAVLEQ